MAAGGTGAGRSVRLERRLGKLDVTLVGVGASIGAGIFVISGVAARLAGRRHSLILFSKHCVRSIAYMQKWPAAGQRIGLCLASAVFGEGVALVTGINLLFDTT